jgi:hypothetical protein
MIGQALAQARGLVTKHAVPLDALASGKQVDRLMSNQGIDVWDTPHFYWRWLATIWAGCVAVPAHVGLELGCGQGGAVAQTA